MKKSLLLIAMLGFIATLCAQTTVDLLTLKNGSVIRGQIIEQTPPLQLKIKTADGSLFVFTYDEIEKITREEIQPTSLKKEKPDMKLFGGKVSLGICLGGGGVVGVPVRFYPHRKLALEAGLFLRPTLIETEYSEYDPWGNQTNKSSDREFTFPLMLAGGVNIFLGESYRSDKDKIYRNGLSLKIGKTMTDRYDETMYMIGWARESFKSRHKKASYTFELGAGIMKYSGIHSPIAELDLDTPIIPLIYWKCNWQWFVK
ncbi:MAG: hypothetical protein ACKVOR_06105 [Flavobacteriales bacterium]